MTSLDTKNISVFMLAASLLINLMAKGQESSSYRNEYHLTIEQAIAIAKQKNKTVAVFNKEAAAIEEDGRAVASSALPNVEFATSYERYSDLTLYTSGLGHSSSNPRFPSPNGANAGINASFNLWAGGKQRSLEQQANLKNGMAALNVREQSGNVGLQTANNYLDLMQLDQKKRFIIEQLKRAEARLKNINALYQNQKVTRSDVLRAEVMRSNVKLSLEQTENDIVIRNRSLSILLNIGDLAVVTPTDSSGMVKPVLADHNILKEGLSGTAYPLQRTDLLIKSQQAHLRTVKSNSYPVLSFRTGYNFNYPNFLFYPPVDQFYSIGFVGLKLQYDISSLYKNRSQRKAARLRIEQFEEQQSAIEDNIGQEMGALYIKYNEAIRRIAVNKNSIEQAEVNYRIVSTKYFNQLALLTDLLDADNLFEETRFNLVQAEVEALRIYYRLQYLAGKL